ncbi:MAG: uracil-DNA glycosylase [Lachnospiraceae bacterium]|nr:uracil-DNA glycosylase [Lachnospiraceae bacterium]
MIELQEIDSQWQEALKEEFQKDYYHELMAKVSEAYENNQVFPPANEVFNALNLTPLSQVKAVIIGQDPYHDVGQAHGLCFSVKPGVKVPPSLVNIYKELHDDLGCSIPEDGYLVKWATQGVLMLNTVLTVNAHVANSHKGYGWEKFTDAIISKVNEEDRPIVFLLWGAPAQKKKKLLNNPKHLILEAPHPSPLSVYRGFWGCKHFSKTNDFLVENGIEPIDWQL